MTEALTQKPNEWEIQTSAGRDLAEQCIAEMRETRDPNLLMRFVRQAVERGKITAVEVGFFYLVAARLIIGVPQ